MIKKYNNVRVLNKLRYLFKECEAQTMFQALELKNIRNCARKKQLGNGKSSGG